MPRRRSAVTAGRLRKVGAQIGVSGIDEIKANIAATLDRAQGMEAKRVFMGAALIGMHKIEELAPRGKTGRLRRAPIVKYGDPKKPNVLLGVSRKIAPHAGLVEKGHGGPHPAPAHPYYKPAVNSTRNEMAAHIAKGMRDLISEG